MYLKVAFCGSHSTGKTTLSNAINKQLNFPYIEEQARRVIKSLGFQTTDEVWNNKESFSIAQFGILRSQIVEEEKYDSYVSDRSTLDMFAYYKALNNDPVEVYKVYKSLAIDHFYENYDVVIYVPIMFVPTDDNFRNTDAILQKRVDSIIEAKARKHVNFYQLQSDKLEDRVNEVLELLRDKGVVK